MKMGKSLLAISAILIGLCLILEGCQPPPLFSYPHFWDFTRSKPRDSDIVGTYKIIRLRVPDDLMSSVQQERSTLTLNADHSATFFDFAVFDASGDTLRCRLSGKGTWQLERYISADGWQVDFEDFHPTSTPTAHECDREKTSWPLTILGQRTPYRLYDYVGDPDSDTGVEYRKVGP
jgi:hypothetical protein